jgi:hypothetical protein
VRQIQSVDHIWSSWEDSGQWVPQPFQLVDLEFTPAGANAPIHAIDRIDLNSLPELRDGATVRVFYKTSNPRSARIDAGTRTYAEKALVYLLKLTFGIGILITVVVIPAMSLADRTLERFWGRITRFSPDQIAQIAQNTSHFPADDPRRKAMEKLATLRREEHEPN